MIYKKSYEIDGKIIKKEDISLLVNNLTDKLKGTNNITLKIKASFYDGLFLESEELSIFNDANFQRNKLKKISFVLYSDSMKNYISLDISDYYLNNEISIESQDKILFDSLCHTIEERLKQMQKQNKIYKIPSKTIYCIIIYCLIFILNLILTVLLEFVFKVRILKIVLTIMFLILPHVQFLYTMKYIQKYYPRIQFDFGKDSINVPQEPNSIIIRIILFLATELVIPIILTKFFS